MHLPTIATASLLLAGSAFGADLRARQGTVRPSATLSSPGAVGSGGVPVWVVRVGNAAGGLVFEPNNLRANVGDMVQFQFYPRNHSVAMSNFANPCVPIQQSDPTVQSAFWSGFMPTTDQGKLTYTIPVRDTRPIWFYCSQGRHCQQGMVGAINAPATGNTIDAFIQRAAAAPQNISPSGTGANTGSGTIGSGTGTDGTLTGSGPAQVSSAAASMPLLEAARQGGLGVAAAGLAALFAL